MREIKFRVWSDIRKTWVNPVIDITNDFNINSNENRIFEQFTGLKDKNGKEIYEGDICEMKHPFKNRYWKGKIYYDRYGFNGYGFIMTHFDNPTDLFSEGTSYIEVIGNIHQKTN